MKFLLILCLDVVLFLNSHLAVAIRCIQCTPNDHGEDWCLFGALMKKPTRCPVESTHCYVKLNKDRKLYVRGCTSLENLCANSDNNECYLCKPDEGDGDTCMPSLPNIPWTDMMMPFEGMRLVHFRRRQGNHTVKGEIWCIQCNPSFDEDFNRDDLTCAKESDKSKAMNCSEVEGAKSCYVRHLTHYGLYARGCSSESDICKELSLEANDCNSCQPSGPGQENTCVPSLPNPTAPPPGSSIKCIQCRGTDETESIDCAKLADASNATECMDLNAKFCVVVVEPYGLFSRRCSQDSLCKDMDKSQCAECEAKKGDTCVASLSPQPTPRPPDVSVNPVQPPTYPPPPPRPPIFTRKTSFAPRVHYSEAMIFLAVIHSILAILSWSPTEIHL